MYVDPNTGGLLFQLLAGAFAAVSAFVLIFSRRLREILARLQRAWRERSGGDDTDSASGP